MGSSAARVDLLGASVSSRSFAPIISRASKQNTAVCSFDVERHSAAIRTHRKSPHRIITTTTTTRRGVVLFRAPIKKHHSVLVDEYRQSVLRLRRRMVNWRMPSANMRTTSNASTTTTMAPALPAEFSISTKDVEGLVMEIKENLRISAAGGALKMPYRRYPKKYLRNSPYAVRACDGSIMEPTSCSRMLRHSKTTPSAADLDEDPYELLQRLLKDGGLVSEAVRRVQLGCFAPKQQYYYESDDVDVDDDVDVIASPMLRLCSQEN